MNLESKFTKCGQKLIHILVCSLLFPFVFVINSRAQSEVFTKWTARFDGAHASDLPAAMAVDGRGNTFVTGYTCTDNPCSNFESLTIAYNSSGNALWKAYLSGSAHSAQGVDIAVDSAGSVYVLSILNPTTPGNTEVAIAKYSPAGVREWVDFTASTSSTTYRPVKLTVAPEGNTYVTMTAQPVTSPQSVTINAIIAKYDTNGNRIWSKEVAPVQNTAQSPLFVRLDASQNVYVLVFSDLSTQFQHSFIIKYNSSGTLLSSYGADKLGKITAFRVDGNGYSYAAGGGTPQAPNGAQDRIVAKYSPAGVLDWLHDFGAPASFDQSGFADLAVHISGDVYVAQSIPGTVPSNGGTDISVVKFNSTGTIQWTSRYNGRSDDSGVDSAVAIAVNSSDYVYVAGSSSNPAGTCCSYEFATIKYDSSGKRIWATRYNSNGSPVALDISGGDVLLTGIGNSSTTGADWVTLGYVQDAAKVNPTSLSFGNQKVGTQSASQTVTLTNTSETSLSITGIAIIGEFHMTNNCPSTLPAGTFCTLHITFAPTTVGALTGTIIVHDNWAGSTTNPQTVQFTGTGTS